MRPVRIRKLKIAAAIIGVVMATGMPRIGEAKPTFFQIIHRYEVPHQVVHSTAPQCMEDMPCWDCNTMGNHTCGTAITDNGKEQG